MPQVIIYNQDNGTPAIIIPTDEALKTHTILHIAVKDVPEGKRFGLIDESELPDASQEVWEVDDEDLTDGIGGAGNEFS